ncbi:ATP-binding protein [Helcococcus kunzii]|uniref:ATP-binding protein n=1 Tax=Helcococcus kunzii TaxID=40091 RepID=UPI001BAE75C4|nr:ATP-binding protein [Helcococcus kunzii]QUY65117.1 ATP-binding protein [Helcococcus kunzii]
MFEINSGKIAKAQKVVIYGVEGIGKSTLASKFPNPLFIDLEGSTNNMDVKRIKSPTSWSLLIQQLDWVIKDKPCETLVIDTLDYAEEYLCKPYVVASRPNANGQYVKNIEDYGYGAGYKHLADVWGKDLLNKLSEVVDAGINVVLLAHATQRKVDSPDQLGSYDKYELKLEKKTSSLTKEWADLLLFLNFKTEVTTIKDGMTQKRKGTSQQRVMHTTNHPAYDAKNRHKLSDELELDFSMIAHIFNKDKKEKYYANSDNEVTKVEVGSKAEKIIEETNKVLPPSEAVREISEEEFELIDTKEVRIPFDDLKEDVYVKHNALRDLMNHHNISVEQIEKAVTLRGYFPQDTGINNYPTEFIDQVLVGAFEQIRKFIEEQNL